MGDRDDGPGIGLEEALEPRHRLGVEMVGRLVEQQKVGPLEQEAAQRDAPLFADRERGDVGVAGRAAQRVHGDVEMTPELPAVDRVDLLLKLRLLGQERVDLVRIELLGEARRDGVEAVEDRLGRGHPEHDVAEHVERRVERGLLGQQPDAHAVGRPGLAPDIGLEPGHHPEQHRFPRPVEAEHADLGARQERERDIAQHLLAAREYLVQAPHHVDVLVRGHGFELA